MKTIIILTLSCLLLPACAPSNAASDRALLPENPSIEPTQANLPNPASVYCEGQGNHLEIRTSADGSQVGVCIFPDGSECEEWAFMRGECGPGTLVPASASPTETAPALAADTPEAPAAAAPTEAPGEKAAIDPAVQQKVVGAAQSLLVKKLNVKESAITLVSIEPVSWPDTCLGLPGPEEMCAQVIIDGYKVVLAVNGQNYTFHTDGTGRNIRQEP